MRSAGAMRMSSRVPATDLNPNQRRRPLRPAPVQSRWASIMRTGSILLTAWVIAGCGSPPAEPTSQHLGVCRLPVLRIDSSGIPVSPSSPKYSSDVTINAGWIDIPSGVFTPDAKADVTGLPFTPAYAGQTAHPRSYDAPQGRWLPVDQSQVAPDGRSYFYVSLETSPPQLRLHDLSSGKDRTLLVDPGHVEDVRW